MSDEKEQQQGPDEPTKEAHRLIANIQAQRTEYWERNGELPSGVVLSPQEYRVLSAFSATLGVLNVEALEYLGRYRVFDLTIFVEPGASCHVIK